VGSHSQYQIMQVIDYRS